MAVKAANTGMIILGGGLVKHHICNANLMVGDMDMSTFWFTTENIIAFYHSKEFHFCSTNHHTAVWFITGQLIIVSCFLLGSSNPCGNKVHCLTPLGDPSRKLTFLKEIPGHCIGGWHCGSGVSPCRGMVLTMLCLSTLLKSLMEVMLELLLMRQSHGGR